MRPERLELEGFTAFRQRTVVDFSDSELFALSGPTGSGKSSLIDAIVFVLYGAVPRLADRRRVGPVISQGMVQARLGLEFRVGPERYRAVRVVRATTGANATTKEARLERRLADGSYELLAGDADGVTREVQQLLGLTYEHFTTAVVLPQGEFARFLHHRPADRQALLKELLDLGLYDRLQQRASKHATLASETQRMARSRLDELAEATEERAQLLENQGHAMAALLAACDAARPELEELARREFDLTNQAELLAHTATQLGAVHKPKDANALSADHDAQRDTIAELELSASTQDNELQRLETVLAALPGATESQAVLERHQELENQQRLVTKGETALAAAEQRHRHAQLEHEQAAAAATQAEAALQLARTQLAAAALAERLHPGDDCPVCGQTITVLAALPSPALDHASAHREQAGRQEDSAARQRQTAQLELARIEAKLEDTRHHLQELAERVAREASVEQAGRDLDQARVAADAVDQARAGRTTVGRQLEAARTALRGNEERRRRAWATFDAARDGVSALGPPSADRLDLGSDWDMLVAWSLQQQQHVATQADVVSRQHRDLVARQTQLRAEVVGQAQGVLTDIPDGIGGIGGSGGMGGSSASGVLDAIRDRALRSQAQLAGEAQRLALDRQRAERAARELVAATEEEQVASLVTKLLRADRFGAWILDEAVQQLVEGATGMLQRLSGGAYSLVLDGKDFAVIDHNNADAVRSARTLSGGETFLASLALALALAEQVVTLAGPTAAPLESLFLDEGFGTLDPDTLDTVATAIEELGSAGRMVGIITHVRELAERLPVRFEVTKGPEGARVERVLA